MSEIHVSPIDGANALLVNGFRVEITILDDAEDGAVLVYRIYRKGTYINTYTSLQQAVAWCGE